ncbi:hypothetical protein QBZ16_003072 [Prototheca wickerhamii]|uniref:Uncharacterized protein n=1 Tax=Prototheca wickerhamii TaxID=3111 RepID=A0AAD9MNR5_PROWI|nr:hypothetical protein QBZ16_003072 [Prototheca wickerhamii]
MCRSEAGREGGPELINVPGGLLHWVNDPVHYLDLGGIPAASLVDLGGSPTFWAGVTKLYASNGALVDVRGLQLLRNIKYLYLDNNKLPENELMVMAGMLPQGQLECLDIRGNPGLTPSVMDALLRHGVVDRCQYVNGRRLDLDLTSIWD